MPFTEPPQSVRSRADSGWRGGRPAPAPTTMSTPTTTASPSATAPNSGQFDDDPEDIAGPRSVEVGAEDAPNAIGRKT